MTNHWPLLASSAMIFAAASLGLWQQQNNASSAATPTKTDAVLVVDSAPVPAAAPMTPDKRVEAEAAPTPLPTPLPSPGQPVMQPPAVAAAPNVAPVPAAVQPQGMDFAAGKTTREQIFMDLRIKLQTKVNGTTHELPGGGYAFVPFGARMEVLPQPGVDWRITLYNVNEKDPANESDGFKSCLAALVEVLAIDMSIKPLDKGDGKTSLKTKSNLGRISLDRDPNNGNSCIITPIIPQARKVVLPPAAPNAAPATPQTAPPAAVPGDPAF